MHVINPTRHEGARLIALVAVVTLVVLAMQDRPASAETGDPTYTLFELDSIKRTP